MSRKTSTTNHATGTSEYTDYSGLTTTATNAKGQTTTTTNNVYGKAAQVIDAIGNVITYKYNAIGSLIQTIEASGHKTILSYDNLGNKIAMIDPNLGTWTYQYNAFGKLISQTDAKGQTLTISYDILGRQTKRIEPEGTTTWEYDIGNKSIGKLTSITTAATGKIYTYDNFGRLSKVITNLDEVSLTTSTSYDNYSRIATKNYPNNYQLIYTYNHHGYLESVKTPQGLQVDGYNLAHLAAVKQQAIETADRLFNESIDWLERAAEYRAIAADYQEQAQSLNDSAYQLEQLALDNLKLAEQYLYWAENPQLATQLQQQVSLYNNNLTDTANIVYWQAREYDAMGRSTSFVFGNGLVTNNLYNSAGQLTQINTGFGYSSPIRDLEYEYDLENNITSRSDKVIGVQESFVYDELNRLTNSYGNLSISNKLENTQTKEYVQQRIALLESRLATLNSEQQQLSQQIDDITVNINTVESLYDQITNQQQQIQTSKTQIETLQNQVKKYKQAPKITSITGVTYG